MQVLKDMRESLGISGGGLQSSNKTRSTSGYAMAASLQRNKPPLKAVAAAPAAGVKASIRDKIEDESVWRGIKFIERVLEPFHLVWLEAAAT